MGLGARLTSVALDCFAETSPTGGLWAALCGRRSTADSSPPVLRLPKPFIPGSRDICSAITDCDMPVCPAQASPTALLLTQAMRCYALRDSLPNTDAVNNDHTRTATGIMDCDMRPDIAGVAAKFSVCGSVQARPKVAMRAHRST